MKAIVYTKYGPPDVLQLEEIEKPRPKSGEVLVKVHAASINAADVDWLRRKPMIRMIGLLKPAIKTIGSDIAGRVEAVGQNVTQFKPGDDVIVDLSGCGFGAFAEYRCVPEKELAPKPAGMTFEEAATLPQAAIIALQGLRDKRQIQPGDKVLINGAGGGMGTFAVQIAKSFGAEVTGVDSKSKLAMIRSIGADHVIDYTQENFTKNGQQYDMILDIQAYNSIFDYKRALSSHGFYAMVGGSGATLFQALVLGSLVSRSKKLGIMYWWKPNKKEDLAFIEELFEAGKVKPVIDRIFPLSETAEAFRYFEGGKVKGKLVITMED